MRLLAWVTDLLAKPASRREFAELEAERDEWKELYAAEVETVWGLRSDLRLAELDRERARDTAARLLSLSDVEARVLDPSEQEEQ